MKSDSQIMNELAKQSSLLVEMTDEQRQALKAEILQIFLDVQALCTRHNLRVMLAGGSCLGAIRHKGFIPWDDDLDVIMPRADYEKLISLLKQNVLGDRYEFSTPDSKNESATVFLKIYRKNSLFIDLFNISTPFPKGIYIDVFPIDAAPNNKVLRSIKGIISDGLQFCNILTLYAKYPNDAIRSYMAQSKHMLFRYRVKCFLGRIIGIIPRQKWIWWYDQFVKDERNNGIWTVPTGRKYYRGEALNKEIFVPAQECIFESQKAFVPNDYDAYLTNLYHDYMQLPPVEKRERHFIVKFALPDDNE